LPDQITATRQAIEDLRHIYQVRLREFEKLQTEITLLFNEDYTIERLNRFKMTIKSLISDRDQR
jgi:hypothetical protein